MIVPTMLFALAACNLFLLLYPYLIYPLLLRLLPSAPVRKKSAEPSVSLLFCAFNERKSMDEKIRNLRELKERMPDLQILAFDDGSTDGTHDRLSAASDFITVVKGEGRQGKAAGMKRLANMATGDVLVFTDANVILRPDAVERLLPYYGDDTVGGVCGTLLYAGENVTPTAKVGAKYWSLDERLRSLESATGNVMGADGSIFSVRRALYPAFPDSVLDDFVVSMNVIFAGKRLVKAPDVVAFENSVARSDEEFRRKVRIGTRAYHSHSWMREQVWRMAMIDQFKYLSRKYLRWFGGAFLIFGIAFSLAAIALISGWVFFTTLISCALFALAAMRMQSGPLSKAGDVLRALMGTMIGVSRGMRGRVVQTWSPAGSR